jgi:GABA(A) receptor-associated protein
MTSFADPVIFKFITDNSLEKRRAISGKLLSSYPDRIPVIIGRAELLKTPAIKKYKFMAPGDITFGKFIVEIRKHIPDIDSTVALFYFLSNNSLAYNSALMSQLYSKYKAPDDFLYITYSCENTFG